MAWEKVKIKDVWKGFYDGPHATPPVSDCGGIFLGISNITANGHIDLSDIKYISEQDLPKWTKRVVPQGGDIVFSYEATLNLYAIIPENFYGCLGRRMALIRVDEDKILNKFLYYYFFSNEWRATIAENTIVGATVDRIPIAKFPEFPISLPPLKEQKRIAGILSAYDDLIENNQKQIKLLEEAAQRLYKQWFIDLRYPGHETTPIVDGLPEGWRNVTLGDVYGKIESGSRPKGGIDSSIRDGVVSVGAENVIGLGQYNYSSEKLVSHEFYENSKRGKVEDRDILVYKDGAYIGRTSLFQDEFPRKVMMVNEHVFLLNAKNPLYQYYLFLTLNRQEYFDKMQKLNKNSAQPGINQDALKSLVIIWPLDEIVMKFDNSVASMVKKIFALAKQNYELSQSRDRLLPKLMNGEIFFEKGI